MDALITWAVDLDAITRGGGSRGMGGDGVGEDRRSASQT